MTLDEKKQYAKDELGISQAFNMKEETLDKHIAESKPKLDIGSNGLAVLDFMGVPAKFLEQVLEQNELDDMQYNKLRKHFACIKDGKQVGELPVETLFTMYKESGGKQ